MSERSLVYMSVHNENRVRYYSDKRKEESIQFRYAIPGASIHRKVVTHRADDLYDLYDLYDRYDLFSLHDLDLPGQIDP